MMAKYSSFRSQPMQAAMEMAVFAFGTPIPAHHSITVRSSTPISCTTSDMVALYLSIRSIIGAMAGHLLSGLDFYKYLLRHILGKENVHRGSQFQNVHYLLDLALRKFRNSIALAIKCRPTHVQFCAHFADRNIPLGHFGEQQFLIHLITSICVI